MLPCQFHAEVFGTNLGYYTQKKFANHCQSLYRKNLLAHFGCVNAINFSRSGNLLVSGRYIENFSIKYSFIFFEFVYKINHSLFLFMNFSTKKSISISFMLQITRHCK